MGERGLLAAVALVIGAAACGQERRPGGAELLDLTPQPMFVEEQLVAWDGEAYAVLITGEPDYSPWDTHLYFARVGPDGELLTPPAELHDLDNDAEHLRLLVVDGAPNPRYRLLYYEPDADELHAFEFDARGAHLGGVQVLLDRRIASLGAASTFTGEDGAVEHRMLSTDYVYDAPDPLVFHDGAGAEVEIGAVGVDKEDAELVYVPGAGHFLGFWVQEGRACVAPIAPDGTALAAPRVIADTGTEQRHPRAAVDGSGNVIVAWEEPDRASPALMALGPDGQALPSWSEPLAPFPENRAESFDLDLGAGPDGRPLVTWESDVESSLTQVVAARLELAAGGALGEPVPISDPMFPAEKPVASRTGGGGLGVAFESRIDGSERVFWSLAGGAGGD